MHECCLWLFITLRLSTIVNEHDVAEGIRLVKEALLSNAVDPITGKIDMDLINIGKSSAARERMTELKKATKFILSSHLNAKLDFSTILAELSAQSSIVSFQLIFRRLMYMY